MQASTTFIAGQMISPAKQIGGWHSWPPLITSLTASNRSAIAASLQPTYTCAGGQAEGGWEMTVLGPCRGFGLALAALILALSASLGQAQQGSTGKPLV